MKKLLLLLAVCLTAASCQWWHQTFDDPEECAEWYMEELSEAKSNDFEVLVNDFTKWRNNLGLVDELKVNKAIEDWTEDNEKKAEKIDKKVNDIYEKYRDKDWD